MSPKFDQLIRVTIRGVDFHLVSFRNPRRTNWDMIRSCIKRRPADFREKYGTMIDLEKTYAYFRAVIRNAFEGNRYLAQKNTRYGKLRWNSELEARLTETRLLLNGARKKYTEETWRLFTDSMIAGDSTITSSRRSNVILGGDGVRKPVP